MVKTRLTSQRLLLGLLLFANLFAGKAHAQGPDWSTASLDPCGYIPASDAFPSPMTSHQKEALADLEGGRYLQAWVGFRDLYRKDDASPFHIWGMAISARMAGRLEAAGEEVVQRATEDHVSNRGRLLPKSGKPKHIVAFNLVWAMQDVSGRSSLPNNIWWSALFQQPLPASVKNREMIILYSAAMFDMSEHGKARKWLAAYVRDNPKDARCRLLLARSFSRGVAQMVDGRGKELPVPPEERANKRLAREHAVAAASLEPNWAEAHYTAGIYCASESPAEAKQYFTRYLKLEKSPTARQKFMIDQFMKTGKWGPPPP